MIMILRPFSRFTKSTPGLILFIAAFLFPHHLLLPNNALAQSSLSLIELGSFKFKRQRIEDQKGDFEDRLDLRGTFTLRAGSDIDPVHEPVTVTIEGVGESTAFTQTIPPGSFKQKKDKPGEREFEFKAKGKGKKGKGKLEKIKIKEKGAGRFEFEIKGMKLQFECCLSTTIIFTIGDDGGAFDTDQNTQIPLDTTPPVVTITEPSDGASVATGSLLVSGTVETEEAEVGVTVNGLPAAVDGTTFAALVPVTPDTTTLTAVATTASDGTVSDTIDLTVEPATDPDLILRLRPSPPSGVAPLTVAFSLVGGPVPTTIDLDFQGDGVIDFTGSSLVGQTFTYTQSGLFFPTVTLTDVDGNQFTASAIVQVFDLAALDALLQAKWTTIKDDLRAGDVAKAVTFIHTEARAAYEAQLSQISAASLANIDQYMTTVQLVEVGPNGAQYEMLRDRNAQTLSFGVWFQVDQDGVWRLRRF